MEESAGDAECGCARAEMYSKPLVGTVKRYDKHLCVAVGKPALSWAPNVEQDPDLKLPGLFAAAIKAHKRDVPFTAKLTVCEGPPEADGNVMLFPQMTFFQNLAPDDAEKCVELALTGATEGTLQVEPLRGSHVLVCCHLARDRRCGVCGTALASRFREEVQRRGDADSVNIWPCSHVGGHEYAGNVITYSRQPDGRVAGHWYGYVTPADVPALLDAVADGRVVEKLWRGEMGVDGKEQKHVQERRVAPPSPPAAAAGGGRPPRPSPRQLGPPSKPWAAVVGPGGWERRATVAAACVGAASVALAAAWYLRRTAQHRQ